MRSSVVSASDRDWKRRRPPRGTRGRRSPSPRQRSSSTWRRTRSPRRRTSPTRRRSPKTDKRDNVSQTVAFTDLKVAECLQANNKKLQTDLKIKFPKVDLNLKEENHKLELNGPPAQVKGAFIYLFRQLGKRFSLSYPQIRDVAFELSGPPSSGRPTPEPSPERKKKCHGASTEVVNSEGSVSKDNNINEAVVATLSQELQDWKKKFEVLQNSAKSKCQELQTELDKCKADGEKDLEAKDQIIIELEKEKDNLVKSLEEKTTQVCQAMEQVTDFYQKHQESLTRVQELEKESVKAPDPDAIKIKKEVGTEDKEMVRTKNKLAETKKKLNQLEVHQWIKIVKKVYYLTYMFQGKYIHKRAMLELKEKEVTQLRRENRRLEVEMGTVNSDGGGVITVEVSP